MTDRARTAVLLLTIAVVFGVCVVALVKKSGEPIKPKGGTQPDAAGEPETFGGYPLSQFHIDHDRFLPATDPELIAADAADYLEPEHEVFGLILGGEARAYPVRMISYHHVVNDVIGEVPITVTY